MVSFCFTPGPVYATVNIVLQGVISNSILTNIYYRSLSLLKHVLDDA